MINSQQQRIVSLFKNMLFPRKLLHLGKLLQWSSSEYAKKNLGIWKKSEVWNGQSLIAPLSTLGAYRLFKIMIRKV